ncbi:phage portal protein [Nocardiopsis gilva YIM 90087]|uniref:Phage portal protein n=1 Tax=Nocardiopsis gilva YIM 90087 TaxID=1235441 RepID=A0A223S632_9ACTN|nr:phage portal protein [Nocardiopsis gilva]ASU83574.1 phage portal protein [Nocardiopsis gilva YIM 90087]
MSLFGGLFERRGLEDPAVPLSSPSIVSLLGGKPGTAGMSVTEKTALKFSAVFRCVKLTSAVPSALPLHVYTKRDKTKAGSTLLDEPHPELTALELWRLTYVHKGLWGNSYLQKIRNGAGQIVELWPISPDRVQVGRIRPTPTSPPQKVFTVVDDWGVTQDLSSREILHMPAMGYDGITGVSPIRCAAEGIGMGLAAEKYGAKLFGSGSLMSGILQTEQRLDKQAADALKERWQSKVGGVENAHDIAVLDSGASFESVTMPNKDTQFIESRKFQVVEVARYYGVPLVFLFETEKSTSWGTGLEQQALGWVQFDLHPDWLAPTEARITKELLAPAGLYAEYSVEGLLRGDSAARAQFYRVMREVGAYSANDIRQLENRPPVEGGDTYLQPVNMAPLGSDPDDDTPRPPEDPDDDDDDEEDE